MTDAAELKARTKQMALRVVRLVDSLPNTRAADTIARQIVRSATSTAANYRAACRARSKPEFVAKLGIAEEESDETLFWLEMIIETGLVPEGKLQDLHREVNEILAIIVASIRTAKKNHRDNPNPKNSQSEIRNPQLP